MKITVCIGTGGVGKTSVAAATAVARARAGAKCVLLTADPALSLRNALGLKNSVQEQRVELHPTGPGDFWATLLDVRATLDEAVRLYAAPRDRERILNHSIYGTLADSLSGMQELMAVERIDQLLRRGFTDIVIDTGPSRHSLKMLDKPELFAEFPGSNWVKLLSQTYQLTGGFGMMALGRKTVETYNQVESMLGTKLVREVLDFYSLFAAVAEGYAVRAQKTVTFLKDPAVTEFRLVSVPQKARRDARFFSSELKTRGLRLSGVFVNRTWEREPLLDRAGGEALEWYRCVKAAQAREIAALREEFAGVRVLPELDRDVDGLEALEVLAEELRQRSA